MPQMEMLSRRRRPVGRSGTACAGYSFAAPQIAGIVALIRAKHPELTPFQIKTVLWACAANTKRPGVGD
jgi:subtilisin family serine protease